MSPASPFSEALFLCSSAIGSHRPSSSGGISIRSLKNKHFPQKIFLGGGDIASHTISFQFQLRFDTNHFLKKHISHAIIINTYLEYSLLSFSSSSLFLRSSSSACMHVKNEINSLHFFSISYGKRMYSPDCPRSPRRTLPPRRQPRCPPPPPPPCPDQPWRGPFASRRCRRRRRRLDLYILLKNIF